MKQFEVQAIGGSKTIDVKSEPLPCAHCGGDTTCEETATELVIRCKFCPSKMIVRYGRGPDSRRAWEALIRYWNKRGIV
jgi:DNA-directed RNA polymerase subunit RPC12/RpoP